MRAIDFLFNERRYCLVICLFIGIVVCLSPAQTNSPDTITDTSSGRGLIDIFFVSENSSYSFNLDRFTPKGDSCVEVLVDFSKKAGAWACFRSTRVHKWKFENIGYHDATARRGFIKVNVTLDNEGHLFNGSILVNADADSLPTITDNVKRRGDMPVFGDTARPFDFSFERKSFECSPRIEATVVYRKFTYPPDYMRREPPRPNYPELSMFHCGSSVRLPTPGSVNERGFLMNYWHILHPDELEYETQKEKK